MSKPLSKNLCLKCQNPIRLPEEEIVVVKMKTGLKGRLEDRMVHKVCPGQAAGTSSQVAGPEYCKSCTHPGTMHSPRCQYSGYGYKCDCGQFRK